MVLDALRVTEWMLLWAVVIVQATILASSADVLATAGIKR